MPSSISKSLGFPSPTGGASLLLSFRLQSKTILILGSSTLAASRAFAALEADSAVIILSKGGATTACPELQWRAQQNQLTIVDWDTLPGSSTSTGDDRDLEALESYLDTSDKKFSFVCVTDTVLGTHRRSPILARRIYDSCLARNIPVNTTDMPDLCDFTFASTHRWEDASGARSALQIGVTTNGQGCRLAGRVKREIVARLPKEVGSAVGKVGKMRALAKAQSQPGGEDSEYFEGAEDDSYDDGGVTTPNRPVPVRSTTETKAEDARRRMKWVAQVSEYWPLSKLAGLSEEEMRGILAGECDTPLNRPQISSPDSIHQLGLQPPPGRIYLVGSGPGHPSLLTLATHTALTQLADLVLSDKLVPQEVLALIPPSVEVRIARKFPGNADGAQNELMEAGIDAAKRGLTVVRLKQGDPVVYGRAGEEVLFFRSHGIEPIVIPGVSSALAGPTFAGIPVTQRGVAESFIVCTGVGRKGKNIRMPGYERGRTTVILMGVARLESLIAALVGTDESVRGLRDGPAYPKELPIAIIERASMPDQRVVESTLGDIVQALESVGEQRPPGMMVIGWAALALHGQGDIAVLDEGAEADDTGRVAQWLSGGGTTRWRIREGLEEGWQELVRSS